MKRHPPASDTDALQHLSDGLSVCYLTDDETETPICNQNGTLGVSTNVGDYRDAHARYKVQDRIGLRC